MLLADERAAAEAPALETLCIVLRDSPAPLTRD